MTLAQLGCTLGKQHIYRNMWAKLARHATPWYVRGLGRDITCQVNNALRPTRRTQHTQASDTITQHYPTTTPKGLYAPRVHVRIPLSLSLSFSLSLYIYIHIYKYT